MSIEQEIRNEIDNVKQLKIDVGDINTHLSILEGLCRDRKEETYQKGYEDGKDSVVNGCEGCRYKSKPKSGHPCFACARYYKDDYYEPIQKDEIKVGDEVIWKPEDVTIIVTSTYESGGFNWCDGVAQDGKVYQTLAENNKKTGKHYEIQSILEEMKEC